MIPIASALRKGLMGPEQAKTLAKAVTTDGAQTISGLKTIARGTAVTATDYFVFQPTDWAAGKYGLYVGKSAVAAQWQLVTWDGVDTNGILNIDVATFNHRGVAVALVNGPIFTLPPRLPSYTVATLPSAATYVRGLIYVSDGVGNKRLAISDGTNWRWPDGAIVSAN